MSRWVRFLGPFAAGAFVMLVVALIWGTRLTVGSPRPAVVTLLIAAQDIPVGTVITDEQLTTQQWPAELAPGDAVTDLGQPNGKVTRVGLLAGTPLRRGHLSATADSLPEPSPAIEVGSSPVSTASQSQCRRSLSGPIGSLSVSVPIPAHKIGRVYVGQYVDVEASTSSQRGDGLVERVTKTVASGVPILDFVGVQGGELAMVMVSREQADEIDKARDAKAQFDVHVRTDIKSEPLNGLGC